MPEPGGVGGVGGVEGDGALRADLGAGAEVDRGRGVQSDAGVAVHVVVDMRVIYRPAGGLGQAGARSLSSCLCKRVGSWCSVLGDFAQLVVQRLDRVRRVITRRSAGGKARNGVNRSHASRNAFMVEEYFLPSAVCSNASSSIDLFPTSR
jgi:hypothetical protein